MERFLQVVSFVSKEQAFSSKLPPMSLATGHDVFGFRWKIPRGLKSSFLGDKTGVVKLTSGRVDFPGVIMGKTREGLVLTMGSKDTRIIASIELEERQNPGDYFSTGSEVI